MKRKSIFSILVGLLTLALGVGVVFAAHNGAVVTVDPQVCSPTTFSAEIEDPAGTHKVGNMRLVVDDGDTTQVTDVIPTNGDDVTLSVGPFNQNTTVSWRVFGGGERSYDQPLWNGFGGANFSAGISAYATSNSGFGWVMAGVDDPNPFVNWNEIGVEGCSPTTKEECKNGGWEDFGFKNQGLCIQYVNTGKDSR